MSGALSGVRVIDLGQYVAGPMAAMLLADQGADVIRVDPPGGPRWQVDGNATWNRGKRSIVLDLKSGADRREARRLVGSADVVVENFRPGVTARLGIGPDDMVRRNPHLVYCSMPGFASDDPRASVPGWEGVVEAAVGTYLTHTQAHVDDSGRRQHPTDAPREPVYSVLPVASSFAAMVGALAVVSALLARERDGRGQHVEVPLFDALFTACGSPDWGEPGRPGALFFPWGRQYECADGRWIYLHAREPHFVTQFLRAAGVPEWADEDFVGDHSSPAVVHSPEQAAALVERLTWLFRTRSSGEWEEVVNAAGTSAAVCRTSEEWMHHPQARASGAVVEVDDPSLGAMLQPGLAVRLGGTPGRVEGPAPRLDEHRDEILAELDGVGCAPARPLADWPDDRAPLAGVRLVDLTIIQAGPTCGRLAMELGADVTRIDDPHGHVPKAGASRGKRSMYLDLRHGRGREVLWRLLERADVVIENFRAGKIDELGFGEPDVRARRPEAIYVSMNAYGYEGPWAPRPGYEFQAQAVTGMQERFGGGPPAVEPFLMNDYATGVLGAFGAALALYDRGRTGAGQRVETALTYAAMLHQSAFMNDYAGKVWDQPRGQNVRGSGPLQRMYRARDGWLFVGARAAEVGVLAGVAGMAGVDTVPPDRLGMVLEERFAAERVAVWVGRLTTAGLGAHRVCTVAEAMADPWVREHGLRVVREHPDGGAADSIGPVIRMARTAVHVGAPFRPSQDAPEILADIGLADELDDLIADGTVTII